MIAVKLKLLHRGSAKRVFLLEIQGKCEVQTYLDEQNERDQKSYHQLMARVKLVADTMVWRNSDIFKLERDNIYAWTHRSGLRLYAFTDAGQILIATNGGDPQGKQNKKQQTKDIETAIKRRAEYFSAKTKGPIPTNEKS